MCSGERKCPKNWIANEHFSNQGVQSYRYMLSTGRLIQWSIFIISRLWTYLKHSFFLVTEVETYTLPKELPGHIVCLLTETVCLLTEKFMHAKFVHPMQQRVHHWILTESMNEWQLFQHSILWPADYILGECSLTCNTQKKRNKSVWPGWPHTVNQLNFAAVKFRGLLISLYFAHFNFAFWYLRIFPDKNVASQKCL